MSSIAARLDKLEARFPEPEPERRVFRIIVDEGEDEGVKLAGLDFNRDSNDVAIVRRIVHAKRDLHHG